MRQSSKSPHRASTAAQAVVGTSPTPQVTLLAAVPAALADVALIDASAAAATGSMSLSWWYAEVAAGRAPAPVIRAPRCTRWKLSEVRSFWQALGEQVDASAAAAVTAQANKASAAARSKRRVAARGTAQAEA